MKKVITSIYHIPDAGLFIQSKYKKYKKEPFYVYVVSLLWYDLIGEILYIICLYVSKILLTSL